MTELQYLGLSVVLGIVHLFATVIAFTLEHGLKTAMGPRDDVSPTTGKGGRLVRSFKNFMETFPFFVAAILLAQAMGFNDNTTRMGAALYFWARIIYVPLYIFAVPLVRTLTWIGSILGILMVLAGAMGTY